MPKTQNLCLMHASLVVSYLPRNYPTSIFNSPFSLLTFLPQTKTKTKTLKTRLLLKLTNSTLIITMGGSSIPTSIALISVLSCLLHLIIMPFASGNSEGDALYTLRRSLADPDNILQSWDPTLVNPCTWFHITCDQDNRVTRLDLGNSNLSGHLVSELGKLDRLQYLELYRNNIQGTIPVELGNLKSLISLDLYNNNISGTIPPQLGNLKSLVFLRLNDNRLTGKIPKELSTIPTLKVVDVSNNDLCGTIPTSGPFEHISLNNFENNPRLEGPELMGLAPYDTDCT